MCGISGVIARHPLAPPDLDAARRINDRMYHRGPDGAGEFLDPSGQVRIAMRRLSIIDLTGGWQPLWNEDRSLALVANGEIYNYLELRAELEKAGHHFATGSDCETIVHLYEEYGLDFVQRLRGMFGFALWDARRRRLVIGRDRMGEKPLYLHERDGRLFFASELKALLAGGQIPFELDPVAVHEYLHYGWVPEPRCMVKGIKKLGPGHLLIVDLDPWRMEQRRYWDLAAAPQIEGNPAQLVRAELNDIARLIVRADVPVGVALSGGLDSSAIAALVQKTYPGTMQAFTVGYEGQPRQDERALAKQLARHLDMPFHEIEISQGEMVDFFPQLNYWRDDPIADIAGFGYYALNRAAREKGCPVLIQGQGGDELFWGYPWAVRAVQQTLMKAAGERQSLWDALRETLPSGVSKPQLVQLAYLMGGFAYGWKKVRPSGNSPSHQTVFYDLTDGFQMAAKATLDTYQKGFAESLADAEASAFFQVEKPWPQADILTMRLLCEGYLLQNGLAQGDRLSMASSVELRLPLVDYKLVELVVGLQKWTPSYSLPPKAWFKEAVADIVPDWVADRPKRGFNPPVVQWINALRRRYGEEITEGYLIEHGILDPKAAKKLAGNNPRFSAWNDLSFKYLALESWCRAMQSQPLTQ